jgi:hypothetical protein
MMQARCLAILICGMLTLISVAAMADDNKDDKPALTGVWTQAGAQTKIEFADKEVMKIFPHGDSESAVVVCSYTVVKDAIVKAKVTALEGKAKEKLEQILPVGLEFNFKWLVKNAEATLDDLKGDKVPDVMKSHLEGKYEQK